MASSIVSTTIDESFPVAGVDNDSQGFRDNFSIIKQNFAYAKSEIEDLQGGVARVDGANNFDGNEINDAVLVATPLKANTTYASGISSDQTLSWFSAPVFVVRATDDITLTLRDFTPGEYCEMTVVLFGDGTERTVTFNSLGLRKTDGNAEWSSTSIDVTSNSNPTVIKAFTYNAGESLYFRYIGSFA
jgi:hypothetical protein